MKSFLHSLLPFFLSAGFLFLFTGCEWDDLTGSDDDGGDMIGLEVNPSAVEIDTSNPQTIVFSVSGGTGPYSWTVSDGALGTIDAEGETVLYESSSEQGVNVIMVLDADENNGSVVVEQF